MEDQMNRRFLSLLVVLFIVGITAAPVSAGGWATIRLDSEPTSPVKNVPWTVGFLVKQHDKEPIDISPVYLSATSRETTKTVRADAAQKGAKGHYEVTVTFPESGDWKWSLTAGGYNGTTFQTLHVRSSAEEKVTPTSTSDAALHEEVRVNLIQSSSGDWRFEPSNVEIKAGTTVTWYNATAMLHTISGISLDFDDSGVIDPGKSFSETFDKAGTYDYVCSPHPWMTGRIVVKG